MLWLLMLTLNICSSSRTTSSLVHFSFVILTTFRTVPTSETNVPHVKPTGMSQYAWAIPFPALKIKPIHQGCCFPTTSIPSASPAARRALSMQGIYGFTVRPSQHSHRLLLAGMVQLSCHTNTQTQTGTSMLPATSFCTFP